MPKIFGSTVSHRTDCILRCAMMWRSPRGGFCTGISDENLYGNLGPYFQPHDQMGTTFSATLIILAMR